MAGNIPPVALPRPAAARWLRDHGLTIVLTAAFLLSAAGMAVVGWRAEVQTLAEHAAPPIGFVAYVGSADFWSALLENWESEFLQMSAYVMLTAVLFQRGSAESRDPDDPETGPRPESGRGTMLGRLAAWFYAYSLGIVLAILFVLAFVGHLVASAEAANAEAVLHGEAGRGLLAYVADPRFWFESLQNWQSEFFSTAVLVLLSVFLRFHGSPESKPVDAPHGQTGT